MPFLFFLLLSSCSYSANQETGRLLYLIIFLSVLAPALLKAQGALKQLAIWFGIFFIILAGYSYKDTIMNSFIIAELIPGRAVTSANGDIVITKSANGHFKLFMEINNRNINFLLDTGASDIILDPKDAKNLGINLKELSFTKPYQTANGIIFAAPITLAQVKLGELSFYNIKAFVNQTSSGGSLLGMSFLNLFSSYEVVGNKIYLRQ